MARVTDQPASEGIRHLLQELTMQSRHGTSAGVILQKAAALPQVDFGEGEPYLDDHERRRYMKGSSTPSAKVHKNKNKAMEENDNENVYGVRDVDDRSPSTSKLANVRDVEKDKDSLDDGDDISNSSVNEEDREVQAIENKGKRVSRVQSVSERLNRDAMSLKRHQLREPVSDPSGSERIKDDYRKNDRRESRLEERDNHKSKREESNKRVGDGRKGFKGRHELYGEEYTTTKYHLPPRSPTFSFRSTIDLLPSSHRRQGLRQQVSYRKVDII